MSARHYAAAADMLAFLETTRTVPQGEVWAGLAACQVHATLALQEETEVVAEQLRRLADVGEAVLLLLQPLADRAAADAVLTSDVVEGAETRPGTRRPARYCPQCPHKLSLHDDDMVCATCSAAEDSDTGPCR